MIGSKKKIKLVTKSPAFEKQTVWFDLFWDWILQLRRAEPPRWLVPISEKMFAKVPSITAGFMQLVITQNMINEYVKLNIWKMFCKCPTNNSWLRAISSTKHDFAINMWNWISENFPDILAPQHLMMIWSTSFVALFRQFGFGGSLLIAAEVT